MCPPSAICKLKAAVLSVLFCVRPGQKDFRFRICTVEANLKVSSLPLGLATSFSLANDDGQGAENAVDLRSDPQPSSDDVPLNFGRAGVESAPYRIAQFAFEFQFGHEARSAVYLNRVET
jgi:hypothetical protein